MPTSHDFQQHGTGCTDTVQHDYEVIRGILLEVTRRQYKRRPLLNVCSMQQLALLRTELG